MLVEDVTDVELVTLVEVVVRVLDVEREVVVDRNVAVAVDVELDTVEDDRALSVLVDPKVKPRLGGPEIIVTVGVGPP
jgi:hypothetical protein